PAFRTEFDDHVGTLVSHPDVVLPVDFDGVRVAPRIEVMADLANVFSIGIELEQLRGRGAVGRPRGAAAREDKDVAPGIDRDAGDFSEIEIRGQLEKIRLSLELDLR